MAITEQHFPHADALADTLALSIADRLRAAIAERGVATIAVSGGKSPTPVFDRLARADLDWGRVIVAQVDERWVDPGDPASNEGLVRRHLLAGPAAAARFVPMKNAAPDPYAGQPECEAAMAALPLPFDIILLGMGEDGHTASLFPEAAELGQALKTPALTAAVTPPAAPHPRMTLTLTGLLRARLLILQLAGAAKMTVYRAALGDGAVEAMPVRALLRQDRVPLEAWISD